MALVKGSVTDEDAKILVLERRHEALVRRVAALEKKEWNFELLLQRIEALEVRNQEAQVA